LTDPRFDRLRAILAEVDDLRRAAAVLGWDRQTYMPPAGSGGRGEQLATLQRLAHERFTSAEVGELLEALRERAAAEPYASYAASLVRVARREYEYWAKLPADLVAEMALAESAGFDAWLQGRAARDWRIFQEPFARLTALCRQAADHIGWKESRFDALLQPQEPGMTSAELDRIFERLKQVLIPLTREIAERQERVRDDFLAQAYPEDRQWALTLEAVAAVGFDAKERGRQDRSVHPFTTSFASGDVRITTRLDPNHLARGLYSSLHEAGHGLYEQGVPADLWRGPLGGGTSSGVHESQSRLWENVVGRSRGFWTFFLPRARAAFPAQLDGVDVEAMYRAVNRSGPSFIRVDADEVTYNLHIVLRCELEQALLRGDLAPADVPGAWAEKMRGYLGITPPDDLVGALQDVHWTGGPAAGFPGYTLGNVISLQLYEQALAAPPEIPEAIQAGDTALLLQWMRDHVHVHGAKLTPSELLERETGRGLDPEPYLRYIRAKYAEIYDLPSS
jgi:carboxypeptidase Taq